MIEVVDMVDERNSTTAIVPRLACYRCGGRMYFSARQDGLGLCSPCRRGHDRRDLGFALLTNIQLVDWSPYRVA